MIRCSRPRNTQILVLCSILFTKGQSRSRGGSRNFLLGGPTDFGPERHVFLFCFVCLFVCFFLWQSTTHSDGRMFLKSLWTPVAVGAGNAALRAEAKNSLGIPKTVTFFNIPGTHPRRPRGSIVSSRLTAPGSPRMLGTSLVAKCNARFFRKNQPVKKRYMILST